MHSPYHAGVLVLHATLETPPHLLATFEDECFPTVVTASQASVVAWYDHDQDRLCAWSPELETPQELLRAPFPPDDHFWGMALSEDGAWLAVWSGGEREQGCEVLILSVSSGQMVRRLSFDNPDVYLIVHISSTHGLFVQEGEMLHVFAPPFETATTLRRRALFEETLSVHPAGTHLLSQSHGHGIMAMDMRTLSVWCLALKIRGSALGFSASGRHLLVLAEDRSEIHWIDLEEGALSRSVTLDSEGLHLRGMYSIPFTFTFSPDGAWVLAHAWCRVQESHVAVCWDTGSGALVRKVPYTMDEEEESTPDWVFAPGLLVRVLHSVEVFSLAVVEEHEASLPRALTQMDKLTPIPPFSAPLGDNVLAQIARLGGRVGETTTHRPELPMALAQLAATQWPARPFEGEVGDWELWSLQWLSGGLLSEEHRCASLANWEIVAEADGGNVYLVADHYDEVPQDPRIYRLAHDGYGEDALIALGSLSTVLASLSPE